MSNECEKSHSDVVMVVVEYEHGKRSFKDEYLELLQRNDIKYEDAYLFEFYDD